MGFLLLLYFMKLKHFLPPNVEANNKNGMLLNFISAG